MKVFRQLENLTPPEKVDVENLREVALGDGEKVLQ